MSVRREDGTSSFDRVTVPKTGWPTRKLIWSCEADRGPLFVRYFLVRTAVVGVYLHHLLASDDDRALHDHPWSFVTFLFHRGYFEHLPGGRRVWRRRFSVLRRPAEFAHRLELTGPTWTLVVRFRIRRVWGFFTRSGWQDWKTYGKAWCD